MSTNTYIVDSLTRHQIYLQRYSEGVISDIIPYLNSMLADVNRLIGQAGATEFQASRMKALKDDITASIAAANRAMRKELESSMIDLAEYEAGFAQRMLTNATTFDVSGVNLGVLAESIKDTKMTLINGDKVIKVTPSQAVTQFAGATSTTVNNIITKGITEGQTTLQIQNEVSRVVTHRTANQAQALIRTIANHTATQSRNALYAENSDVIDKEKFVATLDSSTSLTCANFDGQLFDIGQGAMPALHFNCRSIRVPVINPAFTIANLEGQRPSIGADGVEIVGANKTYGGWLKGQPAAFQDEVLGNDRGALFRRGGLSIDKFTDKRGISYTLKELEALEPHAFELANL